VQVDLSSIAAYRAKEAELEMKLKGVEEATARRDAERERGEQLKKKRLEEFMSGFRKISNHLKQMYQVCLLPSLSFTLIPPPLLSLSLSLTADDHTGR
jgi:structural maintenance of chromosome 4